MDLKLLLLFSILTSSVYGAAGQDEFDGPLPDPPNELEDYINGLGRGEMNRGWGEWWNKVKDCAEKLKKGQKCWDRDFNRIMEYDFDRFLAESGLDGAGMNRGWRSWWNKVKECAEKLKKGQKC